MATEKEKPEKPAPADKEKAAPEKPAPAEKEKGGAAEAAAPAKGGKGPLIFAAAAVVLAPVLSLAVAQFVLLPKLEKKLAASPASAEADAAPAAAGADDKKDGKSAAPPTYEFANVVVNLAGTMGTRYLKTSFIVTGAKDSNLQKVFEDNKAKLTDVTLNVLSALTLADLEEPGSKNVLREKLVGAYNQALDHKIADQVYFSDFVVQ